MSRQVVLFDLEGNYLAHFELSVDRNFWQPPWITKAKNFGSYGVGSIPVCNNTLGVYNGKLYSIADRGKDKGLLIFEYNKDFVITESLKLHEYLGSAYFAVRRIKNSFYLFDNWQPIISKLTLNN